MVIIQVQLKEFPDEANGGEGNGGVESSVTCISVGGLPTTCEKAVADELAGVIVKELDRCINKFRKAVLVEGEDTKRQIPTRPVAPLNQN